MVFGALFKEMWHHAAGHRNKIVYYMVLHILSLTASVFTPLIFAQILNAIQTLPRDEILKEVMFWVAVWVATFIWSTLTHRVGRYYEFDVGFHVRKSFQTQSYAHLTMLPIKWHKNHASGNTVNRIHLASEGLYNFATKQFFYYATVINLIGPVAILLYMSWSIAVFTTLFSIATVLIMRRFDKALVHSFSIFNEAQHNVASTLFDYVSNIKTLITLRITHKTVDELAKTMDDMYPPLMRAETWINAWKWFVLSFLIVLLQLGVVLAYVWQKLQQNSNILIGNVAAVFQYLRQIADGFSQGTQQYQEIIRFHTDYMAIRPILDSPVHHSENISLPRQAGSYQIEKLSFSYSEGFRTLDNVNLAFSKGEKIALVGESGAGKTSLLNILRGLHDSDEGCVWVDNTKFENLQLLFNMTTLIPQEPEIFKNTVLFNITAGLDYKEEDIREAIYLARFESILSRLPKGLETDVTEKGISLSGGERQRLALARGILAAQNSSIILLDEPTSSIDKKNEIAIYNNLLKKFDDRVIISSLHKPHLFKKFDTIVLMDKGKILTKGSYEDLENKNADFMEYMRTEDSI